MSARETQSIGMREEKKELFIHRITNDHHNRRRPCHDACKAQEQEFHFFIPAMNAIGITANSC